MRNSSSVGTPDVQTDILVKRLSLTLFVFVFVRRSILSLVDDGDRAGNADPISRWPYAYPPIFFKASQSRARATRRPSPSLPASLLGPACAARQVVADGTVAVEHTVVAGAQ